MAHIGAGGHYEEPTKASVVAFITCNGADADPETLFAAVRERLEEVRDEGGRGDGYINGAMRNMPGMWARYRAYRIEQTRTKEMDWDGPEECASIEEAEAIVKKSLDDMLANAVAFKAANDLINETRAKIEAAKEADEHVMAYEITRRAGWEIDWYNQTPNAENINSDCWDAVVPAPPAMEQREIVCSMALGKTHHAVDRAIKAAKAGLHVGVSVATHKLAADWARRINAAAEASGSDIRASVWYGEAKPEGSPACPRHEERHLLRRAGQEPQQLCVDTARGRVCKWHEGGREGLMGNVCLYRAQRAVARGSSIIIMCGAAMLGDKAPEPVVRSPYTVRVVDPRTGKKTKIRAKVTPPAFDLLITDEADLLQLIDGVEDTHNDTPLSERPQEMTLARIAEFARDGGAFLEDEDILGGILRDYPEDARSRAVAACVGDLRDRWALTPPPRLTRPIRGGGFSSKELERARRAASPHDWPPYCPPRMPPEHRKPFDKHCDSVVADMEKRVRASSTPRLSPTGIDDGQPFNGWCGIATRNWP